MATALSPLLGAVAIKRIAAGHGASAWAPWLGTALLLILICWLLLRDVAQRGERFHVNINRFERADQEVLTFLIAYLLPFISEGSLTFDENWAIGAYVLVLLVVVIAHAGAFHFNPVLALLGYHFYGIRDSNGVPQLVISRKELRRPGREVEAVQLARHIFLAVE